MKDLKSISKHISCALRHTPERYGLELDASGAVEVAKLLDALRSLKPAWSDLDEAILLEIQNSFDKKRFEISEGKIRAYYGHSVRVESPVSPADPPAYLYHGTSENVLHLIKSAGISPMQRQHVHLSSDIETAKNVANRKLGKTVILKIDTKKAACAGVKFYHGNQTTWLADAIPWNVIAPDNDKLL